MDSKCRMVNIMAKAKIKYSFFSNDDQFPYIPKKEEYKDIIGECLQCGEAIRYIDQKCNKCGLPNLEWEDEEEGRCFNCHAYIGKEKYCRWCGTKTGEGKFEPFQDLSKYQCIYGPMPVERIHTCKECGYSWTTCSMIDNQKYCPECGGSSRGYERGINLEDLY